MPACPAYDALLESFADGEIDGAGLANLRAHLDACAGCRRDLRVRTRLKLRIAGDGFPPLPEGLRHDIERRLSPAPRLRFAIVLLILVLLLLLAAAALTFAGPGRPAPAPSPPGATPEPPPPPVGHTPIGFLSLLHRQVLAGDLKWPLVEFKSAAEVSAYLEKVFGETVALPDPPESGWSLTHVGHRGFCPDCARAAGGDLRQTYVQALEGLFPDVPSKAWIMLQGQDLLVSCVVIGKPLALPDGRKTARGMLHAHGRNAILVQRTPALTIFWIAESEGEALVKRLGG